MPPSSEDSNYVLAWEVGATHLGHALGPVHDHNSKEAVRLQSSELG
jgi:hypothetical protein